MSKLINIGVSRSSFISQVFEKRLFFCRGAVTENAIDWEALNDILISWDPSDGMLKLFRDGARPVSSFTNCIQDIDTIRIAVAPDRLRAEMQAGATLVMDRIERRSSYLSALCAHFTELVGEKAVANGYAAFGGKGSFGHHWDTHDVFAVQLIGRKHWKVYRPTFDLPLKAQTSRSSGHECPSDPVFDDYLETGDVLYIPRGWWHEAMPLDGQATFHVAIGVHTAKMIDYFQWLCQENLDRHLAARHTFKIGSDNSNRVRDAVKIFERELLDKRNIELFERKMMELKGQGVDRKVLNGKYYLP
ncbi:JmjC domain-containing protein [Cupriavidus necator]|uniref:JmjC domain-containing protein n=1 Tax=Cupriavidus necator TaxID=106590 RepID=UPI0027877B49|nr:cupin domain-containing protein [Cupriavidus necator]MDQ0142631.1 ribosomal protein L16 Arg81 hydroxylase [Cupriavidus necator]